MTTSLPRRTFLGLAAAGAGALATAGCGAGGGTPGGKVTLRYWTWATNAAQMAEAWNRTHPRIQVNVVQAAGPDDMLPKLLAAVRAGQGPDIAQAEYHKLPNLVVSGIAKDISDYADMFADRYSDAVRELVTMDGVTYAVPQDVAPMLFMYRRDLFAKYRLDVPETWEDYARLARRVPEVAPDSVLGGLPLDASMAAAYAQPLGARWWSTDGESWHVGIDGSGTRRIAAFWDELTGHGLTDESAMWTPEWGTKMNSGRLLSWTVGAWGPGSAVSVAPKTAGRWAVAPMPTWAGEKSTGLMGGSSAMLTKDVRHPEAAVEFLTWLNATAAGTRTLAANGGLFPASDPGLEQVAGRPAPELVKGQRDFWDVAVTAAQRAAPVTWGPNVQVGFDTWEDEVKKVTGSGASFREVTAATQRAVVADLERTGFTVTDRPHTSRHRSAT
ncbi:MULTISPECIES: extracellular solute-binding protein [unclassified Streptomyces]|uniref:extracellular solute-binding protein n=1 Tax=unclassified Streptomyces TaxID=2593676 RepID=UPI00278C82F9|nr:MULTISPECIES: extracellular solute-binding protein [unclassified Streptomyces]